MRTQLRALAAGAAAAARGAQAREAVGQAVTGLGCGILFGQPLCGVAWCAAVVVGFACRGAVARRKQARRLFAATAVWVGPNAAAWACLVAVVARADRPGCTAVALLLAAFGVAGHGGALAWAWWADGARARDERRSQERRAAADARWAARAPRPW